MPHTTEDPELGEVNKTAKRLISLEDHERSFWERHNAPKHYFNGLECPKCGKELEDNPNIVLTSYPPQTPIFCECGFKGSRH